MASDDPFTITPALASKLASIHAHMEELLSPGGHPFDAHALRTLLEDSEVEEWMGRMRSLAMVPVLRQSPT